MDNIHGEISRIFSQNKDFIHYLTGVWISKEVLKHGLYDIQIPSESEQDIWFHFGDEPVMAIPAAEQTNEGIIFHIIPEYEQLKDLRVRKPDNWVYPYPKKGTEYWVASIVYGTDFERLSYYYTNEGEARAKLISLVRDHTSKTDIFQSYDIDFDAINQDQLLEKLETVQGSVEANLYLEDESSFSIDFWHVIV